MPDMESKELKLGARKANATVESGTNKCRSMRVKPAAPLSMDMPCGIIAMRSAAGSCPTMVVLFPSSSFITRS